MTDRADVDDATTDDHSGEQLRLDFAVDDLVEFAELIDDAGGDGSIDPGGSVDPVDHVDSAETVQITALDADEHGMPRFDADSITDDAPADDAPADGAPADRVPADAVDAPTGDEDVDVDPEIDTTIADGDENEDSDLDAALELDAAIRLASNDPAEWRRVRKWDRPPEPRDWRFFVGSLGRIMLATGVLMFGFVAYQLWGTGIETARAQNSLEDRFAAALAEQPADDDSVGTGDDGPATDAAPGTATATSDDEDDEGDDGTAEPGDDGVDDLPVAEQIGDDGVYIPVIPDLSDEAVEQEIPEIERGDALARLEIPKIGQDVYVVPGVDIDDLKNGPGHYPDTPLPGQLGNAAIAGHRTTYGSHFFDVDQLEPGDELRVTMLTGDQYVYEVTGIEIVEATDYWVVSTTNPDTAELTLTSCHPKYSARQRIVVRSVLNPEKSSTVGFPTTYELAPGNDTPIPGDDPVIEAGDPQLVEGDQIGGDGIDADPGGAAANVDDPAVDGDTVADDADADANDTATEDEPDTGAATATDRDGDDDVAAGGSLGDAVGLAAGDEFARGWFDDSAAWPQILLWGLALTAIALAAHRISRRFRRDLVGAAVGIVPFVVVLYFFFQNVHRLLPPGI